MQAKQWEVRLSGTGGQGLVTAGIILAEGAGIYDGKEVVQTQVYGPQSRGGASRSEVIISDEPVMYPEVTESDVLLAMSQEAADAYIHEQRAEGIVLVDSTFVKVVPETRAKVYAIPLTKIAREVARTEIVASIVALGALATLTGIVSQDGLEQAVLARAPKGTEEANRAALHAGFAAGHEVREQ
ncbi:MAG: 2-oxoacid:acceptor oxidoreductase family protein [Chloroflexi bacterium]|nr:2-oxoacid:acceptor oxidoreductase family protein [Chloroflexota bacterium]MCL5026152.1 2-oxoacid:acceptor oxidoreductase family protein [Chloroflexota bacterium]